MDGKTLVEALRLASDAALMYNHSTWAMLMHNAADEIVRLEMFNTFWEESANNAKKLLEDKLPKWITVTERLPKPETEVLAAFDDGYVWAMWQKWSLTDEYEEWESPFDYYKDVGAGIHTVTHWMPLPEPYHGGKNENR